MSGARALASARRRRASPDDSRPTNQRNPPPPPVPRSITNEVVDVPKPPQKFNPATMLLNHNKVIENLQEVVSNLNSNMETNVEETKEVQKRLDSLQLDDNNIEYFKDKMVSIEKQMSDIKRHILKVQTFAMETNLQCIEMKKKLAFEPKSNEEQLEEAEKVSVLLSDDNEIIGS